MTSENAKWVVVVVAVVVGLPVAANCTWRGGMDKGACRLNEEIGVEEAEIRLSWTELEERQRLEMMRLEENDGHLAAGEVCGQGFGHLPEAHLHSCASGSCRTASRFSATLT